MNLCISYITNQWPRDLNKDFTLGNCWFGSVESKNNTDLDKYKYSGYLIGFDSCSEFSFTNESVGKSFIMIGAAMSSSVHMDNKKKRYLDSW